MHSTESLAWNMCFVTSAVTMMVDADMIPPESAGRSYRVLN